MSTSTIIPQTTERNQAPSGLPLYDTVGDNLYRKGYLASRYSEHLICVEKEDGNYYLVNPRLNTCTCEAGRRGNDCKHRKGLADLVSLSVQFWFSCGEGIAAKHLNDWWGEYTEWLGGRN